MPRLRFGYVVVSVNPLLALGHGVLAERCGFDAVWVPDHFVDVNGDRLEPWSVLSAIAAKTRRAKLGSAVTDTQRSHPARTAQAVASLDWISGGRAMLGIGAGEAMNVVPFGLPWDAPHDRVNRLAEAIQVIKLLWASTREQPVNFMGTYYNLNGAFLSQPPKQRPHPPVYVGAFASRAGLEVVGRFGEGWYSWLNTPDTFKKRWAVIQDAARFTGRDPDKIDAESHLMFALPRNAPERKAAMLAAKATLLMERSTIKSFGYRPESEHYQHLIVRKEDVARVMAAAENIPDEYVHRSMAVGGLEEIEQKIEGLRKAGVKHIAAVDLLAPKTVKRTLPLFGKLMKRLR